MSREPRAQLPRPEKKRPRPEFANPAEDQASDGSAEPSTPPQPPRGLRFVVDNPLHTTPTTLPRFERLFSGQLVIALEHTPEQQFAALVKRLLLTLRCGADPTFLGETRETWEYSSLLQQLKRFAEEFHLLSTASAHIFDKATKIYTLLMQFIQDNQNSSVDEINQNALRFYYTLRFPEALSQYLFAILDFYGESPSPSFHYLDSLLPVNQVIEQLLRVGVKLIKTAPHQTPRKIFNLLDERASLLLAFQQTLTTLEARRVHIILTTHEQTITALNDLLTECKLEKYHFTHAMDKSDVERNFRELQTKLRLELRRYTDLRYTDLNADGTDNVRTVPFKNAIEALDRLVKKIQEHQAVIIAIQNKFFNELREQVEKHFNAMNQNSFRMEWELNSFCCENEDVHYNSYSDQEYVTEAQLLSTAEKMAQFGLNQETARETLRKLNERYKTICQEIDEGILALQQEPTISAGKVAAFIREHVNALNAIMIQLTKFGRATEKVVSTINAHIQLIKKPLETSVFNALTETQKAQYYGEHLKGQIGLRGK